MRRIRNGLSLAAALLLATVVIYATASYPSSVKSFATRTNGQTISASWFNDLQDEVVAIEGGLLNGFAHVLKPSTNGGQDLGASGVHWGTAYINTLNLNGSAFSTLAVRGCDVRLTLTSGTPVTTTDVTGATTVYATPYVRDGGGPAFCAFYDGSSLWSTIAITEVSIALGTLTSGLPYDVFCYSNSGTFACDAPVAWTNGTTRATALVAQNGVYVKSGATTRRYFGTFYTSSTTATEDSYAKRYVWNYYNRVDRISRAVDSTTTWTYGTNTIRQANGASGNQCDVMFGVAEDAVTAQVSAGVQSGSAGNIKIGIGKDATNAFAAGALFGSTSIVTGKLQFQALLYEEATVGHHTYPWLEYAEVNSTFYGTDSGYQQSGIVCRLKG